MVGILVEDLKLGYKESPPFFFLSSLLFPASEKVGRKPRSPWGRSIERGLGLLVNPQGCLRVPGHPALAVPAWAPFSPSLSFISVVE